ncbi:MAG: Holliday junction resolvase RuvX [Patescibacteria group bacterium]
MKKLLGLDFGQKRIGVAISEGSLITSYGVVNNDSLEEAIHEIGKICHGENVSKIVVGLPKSKSNIQADKVRKFAIELAKKLDLEIDFVDETLTSKEAERQLGNQKLDPREKRYKEEIDKLSAKYILEQYLNEG